MKIIYVALAGNPNIEKSTVFNRLTDHNQHTGNWAGKTVATAQGKYTFKNTEYTLIDLPGTYSLMAHSSEEEVARNFICFENPAVVIVVCDATCLQRNLNLVLQTIEITSKVIVCINLINEAKKLKIQLDCELLQKILGVPVVKTIARKGEGFTNLMKHIYKVHNNLYIPSPLLVPYIEPIENSIEILEPIITVSLNENLGFNITDNEEVMDALEICKNLLSQYNITQAELKDSIISSIILTCQEISAHVIHENIELTIQKNLKLDKFLTKRLTEIPIMILLLIGIFWITITGANYPSRLLAEGLFFIQVQLTTFSIWLGTPDWVHSILVLGGYRVLTWVVSAMLPPMAIFFPMFTFLEDLGYLPRIQCLCSREKIPLHSGFHNQC
jgi:ferrous iron transport protein B